MSILSQLAITQATALAGSTLGRIDLFIDSLDDKLKAYNALNNLEEIGGASIAADVVYTLTVPTDWDGTPANVQAALDELASRAKGIEGKTDLITVTAAVDLDDVKSKAESALQSGANHSVLTLDDGTNPHGTTQSDVGLANVDNTSDLNKPVSTATQTALNAKKDDFTENTAFNKDFGTSAGEVLEGDTTTITPTQASNISTNNAKVSFPEAPSDGKQYARKDAAWEEVAASGTASPLPIIALTSTDNSSTFTEASPLIVPWDVESEKDTGFTHSNSTNNSRIVVSDDSTYQFGGALRVFNAGDQRVQPLPKLRIDGAIQDMAVDSGYIRSSGSASDYWSLEFTFRPLKLTSGQYVEIQIGLESSNPGTFDGTLIGDESNFWGVKLQGATGATGATGAGSNIILQKDDVTVGTTTSTLNIEGNATVTDEGAGKTTVLISGGGDTWYNQSSTNTNGGTVNAAFGSPLECVPSSGTLEITVAETGTYVIYGAINIGTNLNADNNAIELIYGIDTGGGASAGPQPYRQAQNAKKNRRNGIQGTWGNVSLTAGDKVHLFLSTLGDSTTWTEGEIFIQTWK